MFSFVVTRLSSSVVVGVGAGSNVLMYFFKWVESEHGGKGGKRWVDKHVHTFVNIAGESARTGSEADRWYPINLWANRLIYVCVLDALLTLRCVIMLSPVGPLLGVIKALTAYISGEMHDTAELGALESKSTI
jgi:hypothetical protein